MTLGNMRANGVRSLIVCCSNVTCRHEAIVNVDNHDDAVFELSPKPRCWWIILFWPQSFFRRAVFLLTAYFLAQPEIPPFVSRVHFSLFPGCRQPNAYLSAWVHRLFARLSSGPAEASIKIRIGCDFFLINNLHILAIRRVAVLATRLERSSRYNS
jgi:hypothetical protein